MLCHGYIPECLRDCILKPGKDPSNSDSYRPIALAPTLSKVFELNMAEQLVSVQAVGQPGHWYWPGNCCTLAHCARFARDRVT